MRKVIAIAGILGAILFSSNLHAQQNVAKINVLSPFVLTGSGFYERVILPDKSVQLGFFYTGVSLWGTKFRGFGVTPEYRMYLSRSAAPAGFYAAPFLRYQRYRLTIDELRGTYNVKGTFSSIGGGGMLGKQWVFANGIVFDAFIGFSYNIGNLKAAQGNENDFSLQLFSGFAPRVGVVVGYAF